MERYNKQQVMIDAHRLYNNDFQRKGRTWSKCMKAAWGWEKDAVKVREEKAMRLEAMVTASWIMHNARKEQKYKEVSFGNSSTEEIAYAMGYGRGRNFYCGD